MSNAVDARNVITAVFTEDCNAIVTDHLWQYDYGQILVIEGIGDLPGVFEVHFSNSAKNDGLAKTQIGTAEDGVLIPDEYLTTGKYIYAYIYLHEGTEDGETEYAITIPVWKRPGISPEPITPEEQSVIEQAIAALNAAVEETSENVTLSAGYAEEAEGYAQDALDAKRDAESAAESASADRRLADGYAEEAGRQAGIATTQAGLAEGSAESAANSATSAADSADRAEMAASINGYMHFYIDEDGYLHYVKTPYVELNFHIDSNGYLWVTGG